MSKFCSIHRLALLVTGLLISLQHPVAMAESEFFIFPYIGAAYSTGVSDLSQIDEDEFDIGVDLFIAVESGRMLFLGEGLLAREEQEIERLQFGRSFGESNVWIGRFHNPIGYWNSQFHHGAFLETSVSRPAIVDFEDDNGPLPMHLAGLLLEGIREKHNQGLGYSLAIATGPEFDNELKPFDVLSPNSGSQDLALSVNLFRQPIVYGPTQYGVFAHYTEIAAKDVGLEEIHQFGTGGYWNWASDQWRVIASVFYVRNRLLQSTDNLQDEFFSGYIQAERSLNERWQVFGRFEKTLADRDDAYLALFPEFVREKALGGIRIGFFERHALKLEVSSVRSLDDRYHQFMLQWDAMFLIE